jgi:hypothetical protein
VVSSERERSPIRQAGGRPAEGGTDPGSGGGTPQGAILVAVGSLVGAFAVLVACSAVSSSVGLWDRVRWRDIGGGLQAQRAPGELTLIVGAIAVLPLASVILVVLGNRLSGSWRSGFGRLWIALGLLGLVLLPVWLGRAGDTVLLATALLLCAGGVGVAAGAGEMG